MALGMFAGRAGAAFIAADINDIGPGLGNTHCDSAHPAGNRYLHRDPGRRVGGFQFGDNLGQVLNGIDIMVVGGRNKSGAGLAMPGAGHHPGHLAARQVTALPRFGALADLDLQEIS